jgi:hypothetical protein
MSASNYGMIVGEPIADYHANSAWSKSKLDDFVRQPHFAYRKYVEKSVEPEKEAQHFLQGHSAHTLVLEGITAYAERYFVEPEEPDFGDCRNKDNKARRDAYRADIETKRGNKATLTAAEDRLNGKIVTSVSQNQIARLLLSAEGAMPEVTWRAKLPLFDIQCRTDWFIPHVSQALAEELWKYGIRVQPGSSVVVDLKTVATLADDEFSNFERHFFTYGYYRQAPFYTGVISEVIKQNNLLIAEPSAFLFIAAEKQEPFETIVYQPTVAAENLGWKESVDAMNRLRDCYSTGTWPAQRDSKVMPVDVPPWFMRKSVLGGAS